MNPPQMWTWLLQNEGNLKLLALDAYRTKNKKKVNQKKL